MNDWFEEIKKAYPTPVGPPGSIDLLIVEVEKLRKAKEKIRLVLHDSLCQEYDDCVEACREASQ